MKELYQSEIKAHVSLDDNERVRAIRHSQKHWPSNCGSAVDTAIAYLNSMARIYDIPAAQLTNLQQKVSFLDPEADREIEYRLSEDKSHFDARTIGFYQTYRNTPVWRAGLKVTIKENPYRVIQSVNTSQSDIEAAMPAKATIERFRKLFTKFDLLNARRRASEVVEESDTTEGDEYISKVIGIDTAKGQRGQKGKPERIRFIRGRFWIYRYNEERRLSQPHGETAQEIVDEDVGAMPPVGPVDKSLKDGECYFVAEVTFEIAENSHHRRTWRALIELKTESVLYLRPLSGNVNAFVFEQDPITKTGDVTLDSTSNNATLNPILDEVTLQNLGPPSGGTQFLSGDYAQVSEVEGLVVAAPTQPAGSDFFYDTRTNDFAAVSAYFHVDNIFRTIEGLGFPIPTYFANTSFPVPVDHRCWAGNTINAHCVGDGMGGIGHVGYGLMDTTDLANPLGRACDPRVHWHEVCGHGILYEHVDDANFNFSHSAGDGISGIYFDPESNCWGVDGSAVGKPGDLRFTYVPWHPSLHRRFDRDVADGWAWGGSQDNGGYDSEEILATTHFRIYRAIGGDSTSLSRRQFASRMTLYLILRAIQNLTPATNPNYAREFAAELMAVDALNWTSEGVFGGAYNKVIRWSFEQQGEYQSPLIVNGSPGDGTITTPGDPPLVDVYIDDGRAGEYEYLSVHWETETIWNRRVADGQEEHQEPTIGTNYAYVKIKNRGTTEADNVVVKAFHCKPLAGLVWPDDLQPMTTPELSAGTLQANNAEEKIVGPFAWTPVENAVGHDSMLMIVSATGDPSNVDNFIAGEEIEDWRLVPNDNNVALRNVKLEPRLVTVIPDNGDFGNVCLGSFKDMTLVLSNSGYNTLAVSNITSSSVDFVGPGVLSYPIIIETGDSVAIPIRYQPNSLGLKAATITVFSDDPEGARKVHVSGKASPPRLATIIADNGNFGDVCTGSFKDRMITLSNSGRCALKVTGIISSSADFMAPNVLSYPIRIHAGDAVQVPIRFEPTSFGVKSSTIKIISDDPDGTREVDVYGNAPSGKLVITGSTCIGGVKACCVGERTISICNVGDCKLHVTSVAFKRNSKHWKLVNNPFPATLHPGACLSLLIRYHATEKCPKCCELMIKSDDPGTPVKTLDVMAYTIWDDHGSNKYCDDCSCDKHHSLTCSAQSIDACCWDEEPKHNEEDEC